MNYVVVIYDTLRYDHVGCNGRRPICTPNWDAFAESAWNFSRCYAGSYPSQPHRCDCATGRFVYPFYGWGDLPADEVHLVEALGRNGFRTHLISDGGLPITMGLARGFQTHERVHTPIDVDRLDRVPLPCRPDKSRIPEQMHKLWCLRSELIERGDESRWPQARVMRAAADWLTAQAKEKGPLLLWIESWRIHEPWIDPPRYVEMYDPGYEGEQVALPAYSPTIDYLSPEELNHVRAMYAASVTFSDKWFALLVDTLDRIGLADSTMVIVSSDHGWSLGDHGRTGKHAVPVPEQDPWPLYEECTHVPLLVRTPEARGPRRCDELVQHADLLPTVLDLEGIDPGPAAKGISWAPILQGRDCHTRDIAVTCSGMGSFPQSGNTRITITSADHTLVLPSAAEPAELYNLALDPGQTTDLFTRHRPVAEDLHSRFGALIAELGIDEAKRQSWEAAWAKQ